MTIEQTLAQLCHHATRAWAAWPVGAELVCCVCGRKVRRFLPYRSSWADMPSVLAEQAVVGSDMANFECPACGCHDRERHLYLYLQACGLLKKLAGARILHFAPEMHLQRLIASVAPVEYVLGDLYPGRADIRRIDLMQIDCPPSHFDIVIANHVLEHVSDDERALHEILRVLRPGGLAILQTPYASRLPAKLEDPCIKSPEERLRAYGQEDHRRLYGVDFPQYVAAHGFTSRVAQHADILPCVDASRMGVNAQEPLLLFVKSESE